MCHDLLRDARLYAHLLKIDEELASKARSAGCPRCAGRLDSAAYPRKPRGGPPWLGPEHARRLSLCCDGCRHRVTPPSVRFFGRRAYLAPVFLIVLAMRRTLTAGRLRSIKAQFGVDRRTVLRWRRWWREAFPTTSFWRAAKGRLMPPVAEGELPASLLNRFGNCDDAKDLGRALAFVSPLTARLVMAR